MAGSVKGPPCGWRARPHFRNSRRRRPPTSSWVHRAGLERGRNPTGTGARCLRTANGGPAAGSSRASQSGQPCGDCSIETDQHADRNQSVNGAVAYCAVCVLLRPYCEESIIRAAVTLVFARGAVSQRFQQPLILTHVTVIDATGSPAKPDMTVVIRDHRIVALGRTGAAALQDAEIEERLKLESSQIWCCSMQIRSTTFLIRRRFGSHRERPVSQP